MESEKTNIFDRTHGMSICILKPQTSM